jgi:hypothetical protein
MSNWQRTVRGRSCEWTGISNSENNEIDAPFLWKFKNSLHWRGRFHNDVTDSVTQFERDDLDEFRMKSFADFMALNKRLTLLWEKMSECEFGAQISPE